MWDRYVRLDRAFDVNDQIQRNDFLAFCKQQDSSLDLSSLDNSVV